MTPIKTFDAGPADQSALYFKDGRLMLNCSGPAFPVKEGRAVVVQDGRWCSTVDMTDYLEKLIEGAVAKALGGRAHT